MDGVIVLSDDDAWQVAAVLEKALEDEGANARKKKGATNLEGRRKDCLRARERILNCGGKLKGNGFPFSCVVFGFDVVAFFFFCATNEKLIFFSFLASRDNNADHRKHPQHRRVVGDKV